MNSSELAVLCEYTNLKPKLEEWGRFVDKELFETVLKTIRENYQLKIGPEYRLKTDKSYLFKALYRKKPYIRPIENIEDKVGTRIVVLKSADLEGIADGILQHKNWIAKKTKDIKTGIADDPKKFDYQSLHLVVSPIEEDSRFTSDEKLLLTCEIQIRTLLQHAFAEISHDSVYKGPYRNDSDIIRKLAKAMALMEATDDYFSEIFALLLDTGRYYHNYIKELIALFKEFVPSFERAELDINLTDQIFELLTYNNVELSDLEAFVVSEKSRLSEVVQSKNGLLFTQPVILLIQYYFKRNRTFLQESWPLSIESLKSIFAANNTSYSSY